MDLAVYRYYYSRQEESNPNNGVKSVVYKNKLSVAKILIILFDMAGAGY